MKTLIFFAARSAANVTTQLSSRAIYEYLTVLARIPQSRLRRRCNDLAVSAAAAVAAGKNASSITEGCSTMVCDKYVKGKGGELE